MDGLNFVQSADKVPLQPVYVLHGDEPFIKRQVLRALRRRVLESETDSFGLSTYAGDKAVFAEVHDELATLPFLGPRRLVVIEDADPFVTRARGALEKYVAAPASGVLVLDVKTWTATTRLAKLLAGDATITCKALPSYKIGEWLTSWARTHHGKQLPVAAANLLLELVGPDMGLLDQELTKLAVYVGSAPAIRAEDVDRLVGSSRAEVIWKIFDVIGAGQSGEALTILDRLLEQGEDAMRILGAFSMQLRRLAQVARLTAQGLGLAAAMEQAGLPPFATRGIEAQLRHLGRRRTDRLYDWLLEIDLGIKGSSALPPRTQLERLVVQLARKA